MTWLASSFKEEGGNPFSQGCGNQGRTECQRLLGICININKYQDRGYTTPQMHHFSTQEVSTDIFTDGLSQFTGL